MDIVEFIEAAYPKASQAFGDFCYGLEGAVVTVETPDGRFVSYVSLHCEEYRYAPFSWEEVGGMWSMYVEVSAPPRTLVVEAEEIRVVSRNAKETMAVVAVTWKVA